MSTIAILPYTFTYMQELSYDATCHSDLAEHLERWFRRYRDRLGDHMIKFDILDVSQNSIWHLDARDLTKKQQ